MGKREEETSMGARDSMEKGGLVADWVLRTEVEDSRRVKVYGRRVGLSANVMWKEGEEPDHVQFLGAKPRMDEALMAAGFRARTFYVYPTTERGRVCIMLYVWSDWVRAERPSSSASRPFVPR